MKPKDFKQNMTWYIKLHFHYLMSIIRCLLLIVIDY
jgi:hypothetical protein